MSSTRPSPGAVARRTLLGALTLAPLSLASCADSSSRPESSASEALLHDLGFDGMEAREIITELEALKLDERPEDIKALVRPFELSLSDVSGPSSTLPLPEDQFYLSVAPFLKATHECHYHSLTTCIGELRYQPIRILVADRNDNAILEGVLITEPNGFLGLWLPRDQDLTIQCTFEGKSGSAEVSTYGEDAATCLTSVQLTD